MTARPAADVGQQSHSSGQSLSEFIEEWQTHYAAKYGLKSNSLSAMLAVISTGLGRLDLEHLAEHPECIEEWLDWMQAEREWSDNTWNRYYELLHSLFNRAIERRRVRTNPLKMIDKRLGAPRRFVCRIEKDIEHRLLAACHALNRPQHKPHGKRLTWEKAKEIRHRVEAGEKQIAVAAAFGISTGLCCQIARGKIWNPAKYLTGMKGDEMRRRVYAAVDLGLRASEMLRIQLKHVDFKLHRVTISGQTLAVFVIALSSQATKVGKTTGENEYVYVGTDRLKKELTARRSALKKNPEAYVFGTQDGRPVKSFRRMWRELFQLAGLDVGRAKGLVWHTMRHEFVSRHATKHRQSDSHAALGAAQRSADYARVLRHGG
jgi:integrase